ncbi:MAG: transcriptional regulator BetI [Tabrizicola sp.]|nr:transcriptional regulator BetI [Tabrizicola sp.]
MALRSISDIRRQELRAAAFRVLQREGAVGTTLEKVAAEAGASKGIVLHYFRSKDELFEQAMREANLALRDRVIARLRPAKTPRERLGAIIGGNFEEGFYCIPVARAWLSLCAEVPRNPALARIQRVIHARMHSNLVAALAEIVPAPAASGIALTLSALTDGLWLRLAISADAPSPAAAEALVQGQLDATLAAYPGWDGA